MLCGDIFRVADIIDAETFEITDKSIFNNIYSLLDKTITYERGDILGYSNDIDIKLPEGDYDTIVGFPTSEVKKVLEKILK